MTALEQQLHAPNRQGFVDLAEQLVETEHIAVVGPDRTVEGTERASRDADVRVVDVAIDDVGHHPGRMLPDPDGVRQTAEQTGGSGDIQLERLLAAEPATGQHLLRGRLDSHRRGDSKKRRSVRVGTNRRPYTYS